MAKLEDAKWLRWGCPACMSNYETKLENTKGGYILNCPWCHESYFIKIVDFKSEKSKHENTGL
jgi:hypothetical protein